MAAIINSYPGVTELVDPICITLCTKNRVEVPKLEELAPELEIKGYANMFSTIKTADHKSLRHPLLDEGLEASYAFPPKSNLKHYLPYDQIDTADFTYELETNPYAIDSGLPTRITCRNEGKWTVVNQYQLDCLKDSVSGPEEISGFSTFGSLLKGDGEPVPNSSATCSVAVSYTHLTLPTTPYV